MDPDWVSVTTEAGAVECPSVACPSDDGVAVNGTVETCTDVDTLTTVAGVTGLGVEPELPAAASH